ncbi:B3 domain-containing protein At3g18960-like [Eucalyptus grandis]|uniref:B3 domain-containing protein At3g18960-like n=1 Tax=Eucalyptus grandis TaxID=71139 RepID=UPI00192E8737|nr:B3 domain-containing protein At3g18960-like [Eucalyptus grandis]
MIPKRFIAKYGDRLPNLLLLKVAGDANWPVELEKCDDRVWISKGWKNFLDYYSINHGHLIVFRYEWGSIFHVLIFDKSASEIEYPRKPVAPEKLAEPKVVETDDVLTELGEYISPGERREMKSPSCLASSDKLMTKSDPVSQDRNKSSARLPMPYYEAKGSYSGDRRTSKLKEYLHPYRSSLDYSGKVKESEKRATPFEQIHLRSRCTNPSDALKRPGNSNRNILLSSSLCGTTTSSTLTW